MVLCLCTLTAIDNSWYRRILEGATSYAIMQLQNLYIMSACAGDPVITVWSAVFLQIKKTLKIFLKMKATFTEIIG